jgi:hypothetical protein
LSKFYLCDFTSLCQHGRQFCPGGWILFDGHCYLYVTSKANWADAEKDCNIKGGHLASIHSDEENALIQGLPQGHLIWIGGSDAGLEVGFTINYMYISIHVYIIYKFKVPSA